MKETHYKLRHRVTALFAAAVMLCSMLPGAAFAEEPTPQPTEETVQMEQQTEPSETDNGQTDESSPDPGEDVTEATPETAEEQPAEEEIPAAVVGAELYTDLPDEPIGSYIGSEGLPVATGETKIGISEWPESQLEEGGSYLTAAALDNDGLTMAAPLLDGADYAIVPIMAQVEYPADGSSTDMILPDGVTLQDFYGEPATDADALLHNSYHETSAAVMGVYVQAAADFNAQLVYTGPDGSTQTKTLYVTIDREHTVASPFADAGIAAYGERPIPDVTSGKITKVAKVNGTWLIWFNGEPAYCCTHGANGQPAGCPTYTYVNTSTVGADQCIPGDHYGNQIHIWGGLNQLALDDADDLPAVFSADEGEEISLLDFCASIYDDVQMYIIENFPESTAAEIYFASADELLNGVETYASARGYYTYIYNPGRAGWQTVALIGPEIGEEEPEPEPVVQEYYASWEAPAQTASGSFDFSYGIRTDKIQLKTQEKVDGATIEIEPITKSGSIEGGSWSISPAGKQTVTTSGHTADDNYQKNGGDAGASWSLHYAVTKTSGTRNGRVGPYTSQEAADEAANSARDAALAELQAEAQNAVNAAVNSAKTQLGSLQFRYEEISVPFGFEKYCGSNGSQQTITVPANTNNDYVMKNDEWSLQVNLKKTDSETGSPITADACYEIYQWDSVSNKFLATGGYNTYSVQRQGDGSYAVINSAAYATNDAMRHTLYYTQRNQGKFILVETKAPAGYFGDWTDIDHPGTAGTPLGKRAYYIEINKDTNNTVLWLDNADYNADILTADKGGTKLVTGGGVETTVSIYSTAKDSTRTYSTDNSGKAANEDSYTTTATDGVMKNDRALGEISISKVDLDAGKYVADHGNANQTQEIVAADAVEFHNEREKAKVGIYKTNLESGKYLAGAVFNLYTADDIYDADGSLVFAAGELVATSPETNADGATYFDCDIPIRGEQYGSSTHKDATTNSGKYIVKEIRAPLGYAIAERVEFEVLPTGEVQTFEMFDDTIKVKISKVDITTNEELPGAELVIKDKDGTEIDRWISTNEPHYVEKMPAGDYTLTEITAPNGYKVAESIDFTVLPTGEMQTVVMKDAREDTPTPTPDNTPTPDHTPQPTPNTTPAPAAPTATPTPLLTIPKTGDNSPLGLLLAIAGISLAGLAVLVHKNARRKDIAPRDDDDEDTED